MLFVKRRYTSFLLPGQYVNFFLFETIHTIIKVGSSILGTCLFAHRSWRWFVAHQKLPKVVWGEQDFSTITSADFFLHITTAASAQPITVNLQPHIISPNQWQVTIHPMPMVNGAFLVLPDTEKTPTVYHTQYDVAKEQYQTKATLSSGLYRLSVTSTIAHGRMLLAHCFSLQVESAGARVTYRKNPHLAKLSKSLQSN